MMIKKIILFCILLFALSISLAGCKGAGQISTYTISLEEMPKNFDPQVAVSASEIMVITNVYDGLFDYYNGEIINNMAESYMVSPDGKTYTFKLRKDSSFYVSKKQRIAVTSKDFAFALKRVKDPKTHSPYYQDFVNVEKVETPDDYTLVIKLTTPDSDFLTKLSTPATYPCNEEFFNSTKGGYGLSVKTMLSNGPFTVNYLADDGSYITMIRVVEDKGKIERIRISLSDKEDDITELYNKDKISGFLSDTYLKTDIVGEKHKYANSTLNMVFNLDNSILQNKNIRAALAYFAYSMVNSGVNQDAIVPENSLYIDAITYAGKPLKDMIKVKTPSYMSRQPRELLNSALSEMGVSKLDNITVLIPSDDRYSIVMENINQLWQKELGAYLNVEFLPAAEISKRIEEKKYDIAFTNHVAPSNNPLWFIQPYAEEDAEISQCINQIKASTNSQTAVSLLEKAQNIVLEQAYIVPMCSNESIYYHKKYFQNVYVNPFGNIVNLKYATAK